MLKRNQSAWYENKRVLITGADGFIGAHLAAELVARGARVFAAVRNISHTWRLDTIRSQISMLEGDLTHIEDARAIIEQSQPDIIFNAASTTDTSRLLDVLESVVENTYGILRATLTAARENKVERFIQFGSIEEYGLAKVPLTEDMRALPMSPYSLGKLMATETALLFARAGDMHISVVRPAATFGPQQTSHMLIPSIIKAALEKMDFDMNKGEQLRDFIFVDDLVAGVLAVGSSERSCGEIFNLGSGTPTLVKDVANIVNDALGHPITINFGAQPYRENDSTEFYMDSGKARNVLGWEAKTELRGAIQKTVAWYSNANNARRLT